MEYSDENKVVVIPLDLRILFSRAELEDACRFEVTEITPPTQLNSFEKDDEPYKVPSNARTRRTLKSLVPPPKGAKPSYGTTTELFQGQSGLI